MHQDRLSGVGCPKGQTPKTQQPTRDTLIDYGNTPSFRNLDVSKESVAGVASQLSGAPGLGEFHSLALK